MLSYLDGSAPKFKTKGLGLSSKKGMKNLKWVGMMSFSHS